MAHRLSARYIFALIIALPLLFWAAVPTSEGGIVLKIHELKVAPKKNHRITRNLIPCNVTDKVSDSYGTIGSKLPNNVIYRVNPSSAPASVRGSLDTIVNDSFNTWSTVTPGVTYTRGSNTFVTRARFDGQNAVAWGRLSRSTLGATYIWYNSSTGQVVEVDTILNTRVPWSWTDPSTTNVDQNCPATNSYDAQAILVHELGHWVGLDDLYDSGDEDLTMYGFGDKQELKKDTLESGDISGASAIYP